MKKIVISCPNCKTKMKIMDKVAKYRCPNCKTIYSFNHLKKYTHSVSSVFTGFFQTLKDIKSNVAKKYKDTKATYKYMSQMKKNMKNNPNWSNFHREQAEEKKMKEANSPKFWDKFRKKN